MVTQSTDIACVGPEWTWSTCYIYDNFTLKRSEIKKVLFIFAFVSDVLSSTIMLKLYEIQFTKLESLTKWARNTSENKSNFIIPGLYLSTLF